MNFGQNLQFLRKMRNMTPEELAEKMDVSRQTVSKWELEVSHNKRNHFTASLLHDTSIMLDYGV